MEERSTGVILRTRPLTETSLIVQWLTVDLGRLDTVAKGARRPKSPFLGKLDLFFLADFSFQRSLRSDLHTLREVSVREFHLVLRQDVGRLQQAAYFAQLIEGTTERDTPLPEVFRLMVEALTALTKHPASPVLVLAFEVKWLVESGLDPHSEAGSLTPGARELLGKLHSLDWAALGRLRLSSAQTDEIQRFLQGFLAIHFGRVPEGRARAIAG